MEHERPKKVDKCLVLRGKTNSFAMKNSADSSRSLKKENTYKEDKMLVFK